MARLDGTISLLNGQSDQLGGIGRVPNWQSFSLEDPTVDPLQGLPLLGSLGAGSIRRLRELEIGGRRLGGFTTPLGGAGTDWFEKIHAVPRRIDLGNILGTVVQGIDLYNAFRATAVDLNSFTTGAGAGVSITDLPALPVTLAPQDGLVLTLEVTTNGPPSIDSTLDFVFDLPFTVGIPITGSRVVIIPFRPESGVVELLQFLTDVLPAKNGLEQRISLRVAPRHLFEMQWLREEGSERTRFELLLFDWHARVFGLPLWHEPSFLTAAVPSGAITVNVNDTTVSDYRVGGLAMVFTDEQTFDALQIDSVTSTSITFASPLGRDYPAGTEVFPMRTATMDSEVKARRNPRGMAEFRGTLNVLDNDPGSSFADASAFAFFDTKVLLDDPNAIENQLTETFERRLIRVDNETGTFTVRSPWDRDLRANRKKFVSTSRSRLWEIRRLLHLLRGRQVSFYMPTFWQELIPTAILTSGSVSLPIENVGYARFVQNRQPRDIIRVELFDGTVITRNIVGSTEISTTAETLTVDVGWPQNIPVEDIRRIDFYELVRMDSDTVRITHEDANGTASVVFPVKGVRD